MLETDFGRAPGVEPDYPSMLSQTTDDLVYCAFHPCRPGPGEIEVIEADQHHVRTDEYRIFSDSGWLGFLADSPAEIIGMRELRDGWRASRS